MTETVSTRNRMQCPIYCRRDKEEKLFMQEDVVCAVIN